MAFGEIIAHFLIAVTLGFMGAAIARAHKLLGILDGSKAEKVWRRNIILLYVLSGVYILIMVTRIFSPDLHPLTINGTFHSLTMNFAFLLSSIIIFTMVNLEIEAFSSFFELLELEEEDIVA